MVKSLEELDRYRWSGHSVLVGRRKRDWQDRDGVLACYGNKRRVAVEKYRQLVADGLTMGKRHELTGGGLVRSAGGWQGVLNLRKKGRANNLSMAKGVICYLGYEELGISGAELARFFTVI